MEKLFLKCKNIVNENINKDLNNDIIDLLSISIMGLMLFNQKITEKKLIPKLKDLNVYFCNDSILEMAHKNLKVFTQDKELINAVACMNYSFTLQNNNGFNIHNTECSLLISLEDINNKNTISIISKIIHELIHYMRFRNSTINNNMLIVKSGFCINYRDLETHNLERQNENIEEGIIEKYVEDIIKLLSEYINDKNYSIPILNTLKEDLVNYESNYYRINKIIIKKLCNDTQFNELLLDSFCNEENLLKLKLYFNNIMESNEAFEILSKKLDNLMNSLNNEEKCKQLAKEIDIILRSFEVKSFVNTLRIKL